MTPEDTTRLRAACVGVEAAVAAVSAAEKARDNAKPRAKTRAQIALFQADDKLTCAAFVLAEKRASILALLDEVERLRKLFDDAGQGEHNVLALVEHCQQRAMDADERAALAYPRALQAAAGVVEGATGFRSPERREWLVDAILELTEEQIEAYDARVGEGPHVRRWLGACTGPA